jgi:hypothetical protein
MSGIRKDTQLVLGGEPRVILLPPEFALAEKARILRRYSIFGLVILLVIVGGGYVYASYRSSFANVALAAVQAQTKSIAVDQKKYSEATSVARLVAGITQAETVSASTEVLWAGLIDTVRSSLPPGTLLDSAVMKGRAPWEAALTLAGPLRQPRVATLTIVIASPSIVDATTIARSLVRVPGFADATPDSVTMKDGLYKTTVTLNVNQDALSGRFASKDASK